MERFHNYFPFSVLSAGTLAFQNPNFECETQVLGYETLHQVYLLGLLYLYSSMEDHLADVFFINPIVFR